MSYDPSSTGLFPDSYVEEPRQSPSRPTTETSYKPITEERYHELMRHWGAVAKTRKATQGGST